MFSGIRASLLGDRTNSRREDQQQQTLALRHHPDTSVSVVDCVMDDEDEDHDWENIGVQRQHHLELPDLESSDCDYDDPQYRADQNNLPVAEHVWRFAQCACLCPHTLYAHRLKL